MSMKIMRTLKRWAGKVIRILYKLTYRLVRVDDQLVIFISFHGRGYSDNPRAIYEQMKKDQIDRYVKNCLTAAGIIIPVMLGAWGTLAHFEFEKNGGTTSTFIGREYIKKLLPNIVLK